MKSVLKVTCLLLSSFFVEYSVAQKKISATETKKQLEETKKKLEKEIETTENKIAALDKTIEEEKITAIKIETTKKPAVKKKKEIIKEETPDSVLSNTKPTGKVLTGIASFYSAKFEGRQTANGEIFSNSKMTCACNRLPLGTWLKITCIKNGKSIVVKVNDRLAPHMTRLVDLTLAGAKKLDFVNAGLTQVKAEVIKKK